MVGFLFANTTEKGHIVKIVVGALFANTTEEGHVVKIVAGALFANIIDKGQHVFNARVLQFVESVNQNTVIENTINYV